MSLLSVVVPAHNEEGCLEQTVRFLYETLSRENIPHELIVVSDHSTDGTDTLLFALVSRYPTLRPHRNPREAGFGMAVRHGIEQATGEAVAVFMADCSDSPEDLVRFYRTLTTTRADCVFGSRFMPGSRVVDYPFPKFFLNRLANGFIQMLFGLRYNDVTNAFKMYRREVLEGLRPWLSCHFNLTVELPLKAIVRGYSYVVIPNGWFNRKSGVSKFKIRELGSRYLFIVFYCLLEKWLSRGDYHKSRLVSPHVDPAPVNG